MPSGKASSASDSWKGCLWEPVPDPEEKHLDEKHKNGGSGHQLSAQLLFVDMCFVTDPTPSTMSPQFIHSLWNSKVKILPLWCLLWQYLSQTIHVIFKKEPEVETALWGCFCPIFKIVRVWFQKQPVLKVHPESITSSKWPDHFIRWEPVWDERSLFRVQGKALF